MLFRSRCKGDSGPGICPPGCCNTGDTTPCQSIPSSGGEDPCDGQPSSGCWRYIPGEEDPCGMLSPDPCSEQITCKTGASNCFDSCEKCHSYKPSSVPSPRHGPVPTPSSNPCSSLAPATWRSKGALAFYHCLLNNFHKDKTGNSILKDYYSCLLNSLIKTTDILPPQMVGSDWLNNLTKKQKTTMKQILTHCVSGKLKDPGTPNFLGSGSLGGPPSPSPSPSPGGHSFFSTTAGKVVLVFLVLLLVGGSILAVKKVTEKKD